MHDRLFIPGPTEVPQAVRQTLAQPMIGHRTADFRNLLAEVTDGLKKVFQTSNDLFILTSSGTGAMEAAVANTVDPNTKVLSLVTGKFGERFAELVQAYGAAVTRLDFTPGLPVDLAQVEALLERDHFDVITATHNETSTGVTNDIATLGKVARATRALLIVDAVSSMAAMDVRTDEWEVDIMVSGSQKAFMLPPGLAFLSVSERALARMDEVETPRYYFDLRRARKSGLRGDTPFTPAVGLVMGLQQSLQLILGEGLSQVFSRHERVASAVRAGVEAMGLQLFAAAGHRSNTVTAVAVPEGVDAAALLQYIKARHHLVLAGGQGELKGQIIRIGHMGCVQESDVPTVLRALGDALRQQGFAADASAAVAAAERTILTMTEGVA